MNSKNINAKARAHLARIKEMACIVCEYPGPSDAHHIRQGDHFSCLPLCKDCHQGSHNGIHGRRAIWNAMKLDELGALNLLIERLTNAR